MKGLFLILLLFSLDRLDGQNTISGKIYEKDSTPIEGANIYVEGTLDGGTSDSLGYFSFINHDTDSITLMASFMGYKTYSHRFQVANFSPVEIRLYPDPSLLREVIISASTFSLGKSRTLEKMNSLDIVMTGSSNGDIFAALQSLPGTQKVGEDGKLYIRGGDDSETQIFIDGMHVLVPYTQPAKTVPSRSRFSPFLFKGILFSLGGCDLEYGQALSAVLPMETKDVPPGNKLGINLSPLNAGSGGTYAWGKSSISANLDYTNLSLYNKIFPDRLNWKRDYSNMSGELQYKQEMGKSSLFKIYTRYDRTGFVQVITDTLNDYPQRDLDFKQNNIYVNSTYTTYTKSGYNLFFGAAYSLSKNPILNATLQGDSYTEDISELHLKSKVSKSIVPRYKLTAGLEGYFKTYQNRYIDTAQIVRKVQTDDHDIFAAFMDNQFNLGEGLYANASGRLEYSIYQDGLIFSPRLSINYIVGKFQISSVYGKYNQTPDNNIIASNEKKLQEESSTHYILGTSYDFKNRLLRIESYYKNYSHLPLLVNGIYTSEGYGKSYGFDLFFTDEQSIKNLEYTLSFSYNDSKRLYRDYPVISTPLFSTAINSSINIKYYLTQIKTYVGGSFIYASGRPYHNPNEIGFVNSKTLSYQSLDMNFTFLLNKRVIIYTSLSNVLGRNNIFGYKYAQLPEISGIYKRSPIEASRNRFFYVGIFFSIVNDAAYDVSNF